MNATLACTLVLVACGDNRHPYTPAAWGLGVHAFDAVALGLAAAPGEPAPLLAGVTDHARLLVPTYDGSDQVVHPDVLLEPDRLVMAITPYPYSNGDFENPSLVTSSDGVTFDMFGTNPIVPPPHFDHNDDPDLRRDPRTNEYELLYLETLRPERQNLVALRSPDLMSWTRHDAIVYDFAHGDPFIVSPAAIEDGGVTHLFFVNLGETAQLEQLTSPDGRTWDMTEAAPIQLDLGTVIPWHVDVIRGDGAFGMLISAWQTEMGHQDLYLATSPDLVTWTLRPEPLLDYRDPSLDVISLYRSSGVVSGGTLYIWYSMQYQE